MKLARAIIAGGGTGGHLFPGIAVAREMQRRNAAAEILFVGAERGIESRLVPQEGYPLRVLPLRGVKGEGWGTQIRSMTATVKGIFSARRILKEFNPEVVIGVGGYASFPTVMAAILGGYPRMIMEQNSIPGLANRMVARWVDFAAITDPKTISTFGDRGVVTGNPIRPQFKSIPAKAHQPPFTILVFGGSQGAQSINRGIRESLSYLSDWKAKLRFVHQTGEKQVEEIRKAYADAGFDADVRAFFNDFHQQYAAADLIVSRSGATTVAEIKASGRASILIPLPTAADDHQTKNANAMVEENAAVLISNAELNGETLASAIRSMLSDTKKLDAIEKNARRIAVLDAEQRIVDLAERAAEREAVVFKRIKHVHFVGIGGIGMSGIAEVLLNLGYRVSGSDLRSTPITEALALHGAAIFLTHAAANVAGAHVVVTSSAVHPDNPEILEAMRTKIPVIPRAEMLAELARLKYSIAIAGTHGKTTTTSMIATILDRAGYDPTIVVGGLLNTIGSNARLGKGDYFVLEADESDRSFLLLTPAIAVVTNIEADHLDHYKDLEDIQSAFLSFINKVPFYGAAVLCLDDPAVQSLIPRINRRFVTFGTAAQADVSIVDCVAENLGSSFTLRYNGGSSQKIRLQVPGDHNVLNAAAAFTAARDMGVDAAVIAAALADFQGVARRFQIKRRDGITVIDDYAHHPTEIRATLSAAKSGGDFRRIFAVFQPHRYTRTMHLFDDFARAFNLADVALILDIYPAGETPIEGITTPALIEKIRSFGHRNVLYAPDYEMIETYLTANVREGDAVIVMGAGSVTKLSDVLSQKIPKSISDKLA